MGVGFRAGYYGKSAWIGTALNTNLRLRFLAVDEPGVQLPVLLQEAEIHGVRLWAKICRFQLVFYPENRLSGADEGEQQVALVVREAFFVERPIVIIQEIGDLFQVIL